MKICRYCGKEFPPETEVCPFDRHPLEGLREGAIQTRASPPRVVCPKCGAAGDFSDVVGTHASFSWPAFLAGGIFAVLFLNAGRMKRVRCNRCEARFYIRRPYTTVSRLIFWILVAPVLTLLILKFIQIICGFFAF